MLEAFLLKVLMGMLLHHLPQALLYAPYRLVYHSAQLSEGRIQVIIQLLQKGIPHLAPPHPHSQFLHLSVEFGQLMGQEGVLLLEVKVLPHQDSLHLRDLVHLPRDVLRVPPVARIVLQLTPMTHLLLLHCPFSIPPTHLLFRIILIREGHLFPMPSQLSLGRP